MNKKARRHRCTYIVLMLLPIVGGSAFAADSAAPETYRSFVADRQAFRAGDMLTIIITESAAATSTARTRADKSDKIAASAGHLPPIDHAIIVGAENQFDGGGQIQRTGQ